jgi:hypothetical protein
MLNNTEKDAVAAIKEILQELTLPPYADSDLGSLLETNRRRAEVALSLLKFLEPI